MLEIKREGLKLGTSDVTRAVRQIVREDQRGRLDWVMKPLLFAVLDTAEQQKARDEWVRLAEAVFDLDAALGVAVLQHFIWQVKRKQLGLTVRHHLMPVIFGPEQGSGKTIFVRQFLSPLEELASDPVLLSDLADRRSGDVLRFPVVVIDDVERLDRSLYAVLKSLITAVDLSRRILGKSAVEKRRQCSTLIGTANEPVRLLIADPTGHRRFVELRFRNGAVEKGGDPAVWRAVNETDYGLLWRSVDGFKPSPIETHLAALAALQNAAAPVDRLRECLVGLDERSEDVANITDRGCVPADKLRLLLCALLRTEISGNEFSARMAVFVHDPAVPFAPKRRGAKGYFYPLKSFA
ncbi:hypothetical protein ASG40_10310 [Methylobacterium sp. Leaf399]|nr:hypothetical protein ASG40_10310 [Methylobacterium sp. Leaf399]